MRNSNPQTLFNKLQGHIKNIDLTRKKAEILYKDGKIVLRDLHLIYKGLFLDFITSIENYIEELFIGLLIQKYKHPSKSVLIKQHFDNGKICRDIITGDRKYADWLPYDVFTYKRAKKYFMNGFPFTRLVKTELRTLEKILIIRNVLAHESAYSKNRFFEYFIKDQNLLKYEKTVIGYLRSPISATISQLRYEVLVVETLSILSKLIKKRLAKI